MKPTRRSFVGAAGALSAWMVSLLRVRFAVAQVAARRDGGSLPDAGTPPQTAAMAQAARARYGKFLEEAQLKLLDAKIAEVEARGQRLAAFKLKNGDQPACEFRVVRQ
jgi:hypothetical protein